MEEYKSIPQICNDIELIHLDCGNYLYIQKLYGYRVRINYATKKLLDIIDGKKSIKEITEEYNKKNNSDISINTCWNILNGNLKKCGIISVGDNYQIHTNKAKYLHLRCRIIPYSVSSKITKHLKFLFKEQIFISLFFISFITILISSIYYVPNIYNNINRLSPQDLIPIIGIGILNVLVHEFGHATACECYGAKYGDIGFGFYLLNPSMYTDVTDIWKLDRKHRIIINLSGIYAGNFIIILSIIFYYYTKKEFLLYAFVIQTIETLYNMNPLAKFDGYWVLTDLLNSSNLSKDASLRVKKIFKNYSIYNKIDWFLFAYGISSPLFIISYIIVILLNDSYSLISFPTEFPQYIIKVVCDIDLFNLTKIINFAPAFFFYYLLMKFIVSLYRTKKRRVIS